MAKLALKGGTPVAPQGLKVRWPIIDELDEKMLLDTLRSGNWCSIFNPGGMVHKAEEAFAKFVGTKFAMCVGNGTDAILVALRAAGIGPGDEVIVPAVTFIASASAVVLANAVPVFVDIDPETYQLDPAAVEAAITERTKAIEVVHYGGYPADMDRIGEIARKHNLVVIEDACEAHGSEWRGRRVGSLGNAGCFSFQMGKPLTCGEGGAVTFDDEQMRMGCYSHRSFGVREGGQRYEHFIIAGNYRMSEFPAAVLLAQLTRVEGQIDTRHENGEYFARELEKIGGIRALKRDPRITKYSYYFYLMRYDEAEWGVPRGLFMQAVAAEGVGMNLAHNQPLYMNPAFRDVAGHCPAACRFYKGEMDYAKVSCPVAERVYQKEIVALMKDFLLERPAVDLALEAIRKVKENVGELR
jgi:dTDP-4-amino-4,6-dideoxygalactose transaminase